MSIVQQDVTELAKRQRFQLSLHDADTQSIDPHEHKQSWNHAIA